eukprot:SAG31_NODE_440_length_15664_cov_8.209252_2_plen_46_part_00
MIVSGSDSSAKTTGSFWSIVVQALATWVAVEHPVEAEAVQEVVEA